MPEEERNSWNYRVLRMTAAGEAQFTLRECHYRGRSNEVTGFTARPAEPFGETLAELKQVLALMVAACEEPVIEGGQWLDDREKNDA